jgi:hypothetical protein
LRSGKPATFHTNVFAPVLAQRRNIGTSAYEFMSGLSVVTQWFGFPAAPRYDSSNRNRRRRSSGGFGGGFGGGGLGGRATLGEGDEAAGVDARTGFENSAETEKVSQMVVYRISEAVSLGSGKSAALPAFEMELPGELMSIANLTNRSNDITPVQAIELENDTDFSLLSGPVSVMRKGSFAGDGKLPRVDVKQKAYVHFGIDRPLKAKQLGEESFQQILKLERDKKNLLQTWRMNRKVTFRVVNLDVEDRTVLIKTARERANEELVEPEPYRKTDANLMYKVQVKAGETRELAVTFSYVEVQSKSWTELRRIETAQWDAAGVSIPEKDLALMKQVAELNQKIDLEGERVFVWAEKRHRTETEQERIRDNLSVFFDAKSKDAEPIIAQFAKLEKTIAECDREVEKTKTVLKELEAEKKELIQQ